MEGWLQKFCSGLHAHFPGLVGRFRVRLIGRSAAATLSAWPLVDFLVSAPQTMLSATYSGLQLATNCSRVVSSPIAPQKAVHALA